MSFHEIALRRCNVDDAPALSIVGAGTLLEAFAGMVDGSSLLMHCENHHSVRSYQRYLEQPDTNAWLAMVEPGAAPVGYVMLTPPDLPLPDLGPEDIEVKRIYLFARFQGHGAGKLLLDQAVAAARELGKQRILLGVNAGNELALAFYGRNGFEKVGVRKFQVGATVCDDLILGMKL
jgi:ribosomal protein S18 acetylase RimI-like enzyme